MRNALTQRLRALENEILEAPAGPERFSFADGQYSIRVANDMESRQKAYRLVYSLYLEKEYARPHPSGMWLSSFDAQPETATLLVEKRDGVAVGALTVVFDSPAGLPADHLYRSELDALRATGRRLAEVTSLGVADEAQAGSRVLVRLFNFAYFVARGIRGATDFVVTVNPRHAGFYERLMLFREAGPERSYGKVGGAPALLLRLDFDLAERQRDVRFAVPARRSIYRQFRAAHEDPETVAALRPLLRPMSPQERGYFFAAETGLPGDAGSRQLARIHEPHAFAMQGGAS